MTVEEQKELDEFDLDNGLAESEEPKKDGASKWLRELSSKGSVNFHFFLFCWKKKQLMLKNRERLINTIYVN